MGGWIDSALHVLLDVITTSRTRGIQTYLVGLTAAVEARCTSAGVLDVLGANHVLCSVAEAVAAHRLRRPL